MLSHRSVRAEHPFDVAILEEVIEGPLPDTRHDIVDLTRLTLRDSQSDRRVAVANITPIIRFVVE